MIQEGYGNTGEGYYALPSRQPHIYEPQFLGDADPPHPLPHPPHHPTHTLQFPQPDDILVHVYCHLRVHVSPYAGSDRQTPTKTDEDQGGFY